MGRMVNARQQAVLAWLWDGGSTDPPDPTYKQSAVALANRGLAHVQRIHGVWSANLTDAGRHYIEHGTYPSNHSDGVQPPPSRTGYSVKKALAPVPVAGRPPAEQLIVDVQAAGGSLDVADPRNTCAQLVQTAIRHGKVPAGQRLVLSPINYRECTVALVDKPDWMSDGPMAVEIVNTLRRPHPIVASIRDDRNRLPFRREVRQRALRILDSIAKSALDRGWQVLEPKPRRSASSRDPLMAITIQDHSFDLSISEESDRTPHTPSAKELRDKERWSWTRIPDYDHSPSGRLSINIDRYSTVLQSTFHDTKTIDLVTRLPLLMYELELRAAAAEDHRIERERKEAEQRARWERVRAAAELELVERHRESTLLERAEKWHQYQRVSDYLNAAEARITGLDPATKARAEEWLAWCRQHLPKLDPFVNIAMPSDPEPTAEALKPFMAGLSPYGPDRWF